MKKVLVMFVFLMFCGFAVAMDDAILVKTQERNQVVVNVWPEGFDGTMLSEKEYADGDGDFSVVFPDLNSADYTVQVVVLINGKTYKVGMFEGQSSDVPLVIDCVSEASCVIWDGEEIVEDIPIEDVSVVEDVSDEFSDESGELGVEVAEVIEEGSSTGFVSKSYSAVTGNVYVSSGLVILLVVIVVFVIVKMAYQKGAKGELRSLGRMELDKKLDELED